jgi:hypothetical protein
MRLRTLDNGSARFFEALGFNRIEGEQAYTHGQTLA